jgi:hypothetical protein
MKAYEGLDVQIHIFLTSELAGGDWSASCPCRGKGPLYPLQSKLSGHQNQFECCEEENILDSTTNGTPCPLSSSPQPVDIVTELPRGLDFMQRRFLS